MSTKRPWPFPTSEHHPPPDPAAPLPKAPSEDALDHGIQESFPASDPVSVNVTTVPDEVPGTAPAPAPAGRPPADRD